MTTRREQQADEVAYRFLSRVRQVKPDSARGTLHRIEACRNGPGPQLPVASRCDPLPRTRAGRCRRSRETYMRTIRWGMIGCGDVTEEKERSGIQQGRALRAGRRDATKRRAGRRLRAPPWRCRAGTTMPTRSSAPTTSTRVYIATLTDTSSRIHAALRGGGQARVRREADGNESRRDVSR